MKVIYAFIFTALGAALTLLTLQLIHLRDTNSTTSTSDVLAQAATPPAPTPPRPPSSAEQSLDLVAQRHKKIGFVVPTKEELDKQGLIEKVGAHPNGRVVVTGYAASIPMSLAMVFHAPDPVEVALRNPFHCENQSFGDATMMVCPGVVYLESQEAEITGQLDGKLLRISTELNFTNGPFRLSLFVRVNDATCKSPGACEIGPANIPKKSMLTTELNRKE